MRCYGVLAGVIVLATACGGGSSAPKAGSPEAALESAVRAYSAAVVGGDGASAFQLESERCQQVLDAGAANAQAAQAKANYAGATITKLAVDDLSGSKAHVTYSYANPILDQTKQGWLDESGAWHWDAC
ncbi:MAG: hypothetical protein QOF82_2082 [Frankiales bacterium]|jgi:hypothetical protein|nr:hypothetical protein [Frankiales bacterium]MDX6212995.1 hypothetical protein [Frankiales bacterium]MDX6221070.1 hypothetical protein [Frankiales bacterium]